MDATYQFLDHAVQGTEELFRRMFEMKTGHEAWKPVVTVMISDREHPETISLLSTHTTKDDLIKSLRSAIEKQNEAINLGEGNGTKTH